jgi:hypothetical protein
MNPQDKLWSIVKFNPSPIGYGSKGYKIRIGDTIKFGRVRFKVMMLHNQTDGFQEAFRKVKAAKDEKSDQSGSSDNDDEVDIMGDMASDDDERPPRPERNRGAANNARLSRNRNGALGSGVGLIGSETVENNSLNVGIRPKIDAKKDGKDLVDPKQGKAVDNASSSKVCRICLGDDDDNDNPLIEPCKCAGTMSSIHIECLQNWLNSKRSFKEN